MKELVCIVCPRGCTLKLEGEGESLTITGNSCKRGHDFAVAEMTCPMRTICTTVKTTFPDVPVLPVRVSCDIPKDMIFPVMEKINEVTVNKKLKRGDVIIKNVLDTGADVIATSGMLSEK